MPYLIYEPTTPNERVYELQTGLNTLGREFDNTIVLIEATLSRHHAQINVTANGVIIQDCQSSNHTYVNNVQVDTYLLRDGDIVSCDQVKFKFVETLTSLRSPAIGSDRSITGDNLKQIPVPMSSLHLGDLVSANAGDASALRLQSDAREQQTVNKLKILLEVSKQLCSSEEPEQLLQKILDLLFQIISIDHAVILLADQDSGQLELSATKSQEDLTSDQMFYSSKIVNLAFQSGDAVITDDAKRDQRFQDSVSIIREEIENCMCVPLRTYTAVIGVLYVHNTSLFVKYTYEDLEFLSALANQAAAAIHMFREFHMREQKLKQQVMELQIQIDQQKKESDVAEIMNLDSFQKLQERAEALRRKNDSR